MDGRADGCACGWRARLGGREGRADGHMLQHGKRNGASAGGGHCEKAAGAVGRARAAGMPMARRMLQHGGRRSICRARAGHGYGYGYE